MKVTLEIDTNDEFEEQRLDRMLKANNMAMLIWDFDQWLRSRVKYNEDESAEVFDACREQFRDMMNEHQIDFDTLC
jgi:hypothetical protein